MPRKRVTQLHKLCGLLAGHSAEHAERAAKAAMDVVRAWLPEGQQLDMHTFQLGLGRRLEHHRLDLTAVDDDHMRELQVDRNLREQRDVATADLREGMIRLKDSANGLYGRGGADKLFAERSIIPTDPVALAQLAGRVMTNLGDRDFPMPKPLKKGVTLDREESIRDLQDPYERLTGALFKLESTESASKYSQALKDANVSDVDVFGHKVARYYEGFYALVGLDGLADRVRRSSHRAADDAPESDGPQPDAPQPGAPQPDAPEPVSEPPSGEPT